MSLTRAQVEGIAHLARLEITEAQMPVYVDSLSRIIDFVEQLAAADTGGVEPMAHPLADQVQRLLGRRYQDVRDLQYSCWSQRPGEDVCSRCRECFGIAVNLIVVALAESLAFSASNGSSCVTTGATAETSRPCRVERVASKMPFTTTSLLTWSADSGALAMSASMSLAEAAVAAP